MSLSQALSSSQMSQQQRSSSTDSSAESIRKRVCKACDRCRLKKSKCDGANPCSRCRADNAICVFGERKKSHDKVYPKGYVEMLEQQQGQLVSGLQEMYHRLLAEGKWTGPALSEAAGHPLTHDILSALNLLESKGDGSGEMETFEEDCEKQQSRLYKAGAACMRRKGSFSSDSDHSQRGSISTTHNTPNLAKSAVFKENFSFSPSPSPLARSPPSRQRHSFPPAQQSPLHQNTPLSNDPQLYQSEWPMSGLGNPESIMRSKFAMQAPQLQQAFSDAIPDMMTTEDWMEPVDRYDSPVNNTFTSYSNQFSSPYGVFPGLNDFGSGVDPMDLEFNRWIQVST